MALKHTIAQFMQAKYLAPLPGVAALAASIGVWTPTPLNKVAFTIALAFAGTWAALLTWRVHRFGHSAETAFAILKTSGTSTHLPKIRSTVDAIPASLRAIISKFDSLKLKTSEKTNQTPEPSALPDIISFVSLIAAVTPVASNTSLSALTAATMRSRLYSHGASTPMYVGPDELGKALLPTSGENLQSPWTRIGDPSRVELGIIDLLLVDCDYHLNDTAPAITFRGRLSPESEIWLIGTREARSIIASRITSADPLAMYVALPPTVAGYTVIRKVAE